MANASATAILGLLFAASPDARPRSVRVPLQLRKRPSVGKAGFGSIDVMTPVALQPVP